MLPCKARDPSDIVDSAFFEWSSINRITDSYNALGGNNGGWNVTVLETNVTLSMRPLPTAGSIFKYKDYQTF